MRLVHVLLFALMVLPAPAGAAGPASEFEARARKALETGDVAALRALAADLGRLTPEARRALPLRVREGVVEFAFRGEFFGDQFSPEMLEYMVSGRGKDYETLLVAPEVELERVQALRPYFDKRAGEGRRKWWSARLVWADGGTPHSADLSDLLVGLGAKERERFLDQLGVNGAGLGGDKNVKSEPGALPRKRVPALLLLTLRLAPEK
jgi:hypothetical protein